MAYQSDLPNHVMTTGEPSKEFLDDDEEPETYADYNIVMIRSNYDLEEERSRIKIEFDVEDEPETDNVIGIEKHDSLAGLPNAEVIKTSGRQEEKGSETSYKSYRESKTFACMFLAVIILVLTVGLLGIILPQYTGIMVFGLLLHNFFITIGLLYWFLSRK